MNLATLICWDITGFSMLVWVALIANFAAMFVAFIYRLALDKVQSRDSFRWWLYDVSP